MVKVNLQAIWIAPKEEKMELTIPKDEHGSYIKGCHYIPTRMYSTRSEALKEAEHRRKQGHNARVEHKSNGWLVIVG